MRWRCIPFPARHCRCLDLALTTDLGEAQRRQQETQEMALLQDSADSMPALTFPDVRESLSRSKQGAVLKS